jgi:hypothetical protein
VRIILAPSQFTYFTTVPAAEADREESPCRWRRKSWRG